MLESLRGLRKFSDVRNPRTQRFTRGKAPRAPSDRTTSVIPSGCEGSEKDFSLRSKWEESSFAAFASLREIFRISVAALSLYVLCGQISFFLFSTGFAAVTVGSDSIAQRTPSDLPLRWNLTAAKRNLTVRRALPSNRYDPTKKQLPQRGSLALLPEPNPALPCPLCHQVNGS